LEEGQEMTVRKKLIFIALSGLILLSLTYASGALKISSIADAASVSNAVISAVQSGTTSTSSITLGPMPNPIGTDVSIDLRIENGQGIWGWTVPTVRWNPQVLNLTQVKEGPFLSDNNENPTFFLWDSQLSWDNTNGYLPQGLSDALAVDATSVGSSGVLATLTFVVTGTGTSQIGIGGGNLRVSSSDNVGTNVPCNSATIVVTLTGVSSTTSPTSTSAPTPSATTQTIKPTSTSSSSPTSAPEFPALMTLPIFIITLAAVVGYRLNQRKAKTKHPASASAIRLGQPVAFLQNVKV
jgi:hypothetical protein